MIGNCVDVLIIMSVVNNNLYPHPYRGKDVNRNGDSKIHMTM